MPRNGSGVYSRTQPDYVFGTVIDESAINSEYNDIGNELTNSIAADGQTTPTGNMPMGGFRHLVVANAQNRNEYGSAAQVQDGSLIYAEDTGSPDAYVIAPSPVVTAQVAGRVWRVKIKPGNTNTGACTLKVNALSPIAIKTFSGDDPVAGSIQQGQIYEFTDAGPGQSYLIATVADIPDGSVTTAKLADDAVTNPKMADNAVNTAEIVDAAVTTAKIADLNVTEGKLADNAVVTAKIADGAVTQDKLAPGLGGGKYAQVLDTTIAARSSVSAIPEDNTVPLVSEGNQLAALTITPSATSSKIKISASFQLDTNTTSRFALTIFRDSTCLRTYRQTVSANNPTTLASIEIDAPASTSAITYSIRGGRTGPAANITVNQPSAAPLFGGTMADTSFTVEEIVA